MGHGRELVLHQRQSLLVKACEIRTGVPCLPIKRPVHHLHERRERHGSVNVDASVIELRVQMNLRMVFARPVRIEVESHGGPKVQLTQWSGVCGRFHAHRHRCTQVSEILHWLLNGNRRGPVQKAVRYDVRSVTVVARLNDGVVLQEACKRTFLDQRQILAKRAESEGASSTRADAWPRDALKCSLASLAGRIVECHQPQAPQVLAGARDHRGDLSRVHALPPLSCMAFKISLS